MNEFMTITKIDILIQESVGGLLLLTVPENRTQEMRNIRTPHYLYRCTVHFVAYLSNKPTNAHI